MHKVRSLKSLANYSLVCYFPNMDPFQVAEVIEKHKKEKHEVPSLITLCRSWIASRYPSTDTHREDVIRSLLHKQVKSMPPSKNAINLDCILTLGVKKVTVTIPKLDSEIIQIWTKTHWSQIDPYSDIEEVKSSSSEIEMSPTDITFEDSAKPEVGSHYLWPRKRVYRCTRLRRSGMHTFYWV